MMMRKKPIPGFKFALLPLVAATLSFILSLAFLQSLTERAIIFLQSVLHIQDTLTCPNTSVQFVMIDWFGQKIISASFEAGRDLCLFALGGEQDKVRVAG